MLTDEEYGRRLHDQILAELGITEPPFQLSVNSEVGNVLVALRDASGGIDDRGQGKYVWAVDLSDCRDNNIPEKAKEAAATISSHLTAWLEHKAPNSRTN
jgi:hypothetical protein